MCNVSSDISTMDPWQWLLDMKLHTDLTAKVLSLVFVAFTVLSPGDRVFFLTLDTPIRPEKAVIH